MSWTVRSLCGAGLCSRRHAEQVEQGADVAAGGLDFALALAWRQCQVTGGSTEPFGTKFLSGVLAPLI